MTNETKSTGTPRMMRNLFGIIMILIYIGMGVLFFINFFNWDPSWGWARWTLGGLLVLYGFWRGYRQFRWGYDGEQEAIRREEDDKR